MRAVRGGAGIILFGGCGYWPVSYAPVDGPTPMHIWAALARINRLEDKKDRKLEFGRGTLGSKWSWRKEMGRGIYEHISLYVTLIFFKTHLQ